ncbi:MAG: hypothetical protein GXY06_07300 [Clostridiaceae bacterium]|nr:hypothetical protein [Clostridiaceae bacterium]
MCALNDDIREYTERLREGAVPRAYRGIMSFMSELLRRMSASHPDHAVSALYAGFMDMTYFAITPADLKILNLKVAVVYLHEENRFEVWLGGGNRKIQAEYIKRLSGADIGDYTLSKVSPGVDSILEKRLLEHPNFEDKESLIRRLDNDVTAFIGDMIELMRY